MAKQRSLQEDTVALKTKVKEASAQEDNSEGNPALRSLKKRLKRTQRKIRLGKKREADREAKKSAAKK